MKWKKIPKNPFNDMKHKKKMDKVTSRGWMETQGV